MGSLFHGNNVYITYINSINRISGTSTDFSIKLNLPQGGIFNRVCVRQVSIPSSYYSISNGYNTFTLVEGSNSAVITIPQGSYSVLSLQSTLTSLLNLNSPSGFTYTISFPSYSQTQTNKYTFTVSGNGGVLPSFNFGTSLYLQMGFYASSSNSFSYNALTGIYSLTSSNVVCLNPINRIFIQSSSLCPDEQNNTLLELLLASNYQNGAFIFYETVNYDIASKNFDSNNNNVANFFICDELGNALQLNGLDVSFSLAFYLKDDTSELHRDTLFLKHMEKMTPSL
jgi:hypothetical protein